MNRPQGCIPDHPCGSRQAYEAGCANDACRLMMVLHTKHDRHARTIAVSPVKCDAEPYARLIRALLREGFTLRQLAQRADYSAQALRNIALGVTIWVYPRTAKAIRSLVATLPSEESVSA